MINIPETTVIDLYFCRIGLCLLLFTQLSLKVEPCEYQKRILHDIATQVHSRSFILQSVTGQQGVAYRHIILLALSLSFRRSSHSNRQKLQSSTTRLSFEAPSRRTPANVRMHLYFQKLDSFIFVADMMGLSLFKVLQWAPKDAPFLHQSGIGRSRSFKVIQGRWLVPIESAYCIQIPISPSLNEYGHIQSCTVSEVRRLIGQKLLFFLPLSHSAPPAPYVPYGISCWS